MESQHNVSYEDSKIQWLCKVIATFNKIILLRSLHTHRNYWSPVSQYANTANHFDSISDSELTLKASLLKYLGIQKKIPLNVIVQEKYMSLFLAFSISELLYASLQVKIEQLWSCSPYGGPELSSLQSLWSFPDPPSNYWSPGPVHSTESCNREHTSL